jgi:hypothetical protein
VPKGLDYVVRVGGKVYPDCGAPCKGMFFNESEVRFSRVWIVVWGAICMASCLFTVIIPAILSMFYMQVVIMPFFLENLGSDFLAGRTPIPLP